MEKLKMHSPDLVAGNIEKIAALFPNCITETKDATGKLTRALDFDLLKQELSGSVIEGPQERYQLDWPGKREALLTANSPIAKTMRPCREESVNFETTRNLYIEGDNLDCLKLLQETYLGGISVIYIDPPYNTGDDFLYKDDFREDESGYLLRTNQQDEQGKIRVTNTESNGRFHSDWLTSIYPLLKLSTKLLSKTGVIFVSISDIEFANLAKALEETFGAHNLVAHFTWVKKRKGSHLSRTVRSMTEHIICYARDIDNLELVGEKAYSDKWQPLAKRTNSHKELIFPAGAVQTTLADGRYEAGPYGVGTSALKFHTAFEAREGAITGALRVSGPFVWTQDKLNHELKAGSLVALSKKFGFNSLRHDQDSKVKRPSTLIDKSCGAGTNEDAYEEAQELFGKEGIMSYPKPESLISYLVECATATDRTGIVLDFYSGSGTTAHAVMALNARDEGDRRFIMVQIPEACEPGTEAHAAGFKNIAEIGRERIRRAAKKIKSGTAGSEIDVGFRVFRIDTSNFTDVYYSPDATGQKDLLEQVSNIKSDRKQEDLLFQVMLDWGLDIGLPIASEIRSFGHFRGMRGWAGLKPE